MNNTNKSPDFFLNIGISIITLIICIAINIAFVGTSNKQIKNASHIYDNELLLINYKVDSIDNLLNSKLKSKRDTIIIQVKPQVIKVNKLCTVQ